MTQPFVGCCGVSKMLETDVVVLGAGAAGMMCAATAGQMGRRVVLIDHAEKLAEKIRISGGGRCNFTNLYVRPECYLSANPHFMKSALKQYTQHDFMALMQKHGLSWTEKTLGQLFCDQGSEAVIAMLKQEVDDAGVCWRMATQLFEVEAHPDGGFIVRTSKENWHCQSLVVATGGLSIPQVGATGIGLELAKQFGLPLIPTTPALVPLTFQPQDLWGELAGIALEHSAASTGDISFREAMLLTHKGVSGPAILQVSSYWEPGKAIVIDMLPGLADEDIFPQAQRDKSVLNLLAEHLPRRLAQAVLGEESRPLKQLTPKELATLLHRLHHWEFIPSGTQGYRKAEVMRGGVDTAALSSKTMMARDVPGLFFIGEVVDVTGWLGGYNFQWAWSSGYVAGLHV
ncbi:NAD(P)/FAD-dependent oxidoreductase [Chitinilyticum litopenaei]|uniref:NAD(P)/FAD-dependent oxidoreductase n=1 Tax=Chitinilyticum litopenaei TaxID=1121276 RepID=UPI000421DB83|nr:NAD(P)/FAD-dependent oxidoreductase [Chitinilyticum litopenaei]